MKISWFIHGIAMKFHMTFMDSTHEILNFHGHRNQWFTHETFLP